MFERTVVATARTDSFENPAEIAEALRLLGERVSSEDPVLLVLNLEGVLALRADSLAALLSLRNRLDGSGVQMALCRLDEDVAESLAALHLDLLVHIFPDEATAIAAFAAT